jgi:amino acid transporter
MRHKIRDILIGHPLPTSQVIEKRLNKVRALAAFSPDALSSIAYANQEIYLGLIVAGSAGLALSAKIGFAITILLILVTISYYQTIHGYPSGGGSYTVAKANLGTLPGLIAASALMIDYILTAAVSLTAGIEAIASAFPFLWDHKVLASLVLLLIIMLANLRGLRETGTLMSVPVYFFLIVYLPMLAIGICRLIVEGPSPIGASLLEVAQPLTTFLIIHAFSTGCTALTGIEAISNGVPAFKPPEAKNAGITLLVVGSLMGILFLGSIGLTQYLGVISGPRETILSALARRVVGVGPYYYLVQISTMLILAVAANTSFAGFPRVAAILARDGFLPRQLMGLGDRLVFSNGIIALALVSGLLIVVFHGDTHSLIPLFAVGVFLAFTLSQTGMVIHWWREKGRRWLLKAMLNGLGAMATFITLLIVGVSKFVEGAWITVLLIPFMVLVFYEIRAHYEEVAKELSMQGLPPSLKPAPPPRVVIPISGVHRGIVDAVAFAKSISKDISAVYVEIEPGSGEKIRNTWEKWFPDIPIYVLASPYRSVIGPLLNFLDQTDQMHNDGQLATVILPEFVPAKWWHGLLHNQSAWLIKAALLYRRRTLGFQRVIIDIPYHLKR